MKVFTIGHSTRSLEELIGLLNEHRIAVLADIRSFPTSSRYPHFNQDVLSQRLPEAGIAYRWLGKELGGYRKQGAPNSPHTALRSPGFRNYADHMASEAFAAGVEKLRELAAAKGVAVMCAERLWWRCHRAFLSDYLVACCDAEVIHLVEPGKTETHRLHRTTRVANGRLTYDVASEQAKLA